MYMNTTYSTKQSAVAMRKRMSDDTNKYNFNRKRILDRIREGSIPQQNTTKKYDISNAEVNAIRKEGNHPPLVVAFAPSAYAPTLAVNEETKRIQAQYLEQQQLTKNVKEDEQKLVQSFKKLMVEQRGKILKVPPGQQFALKTFHDYVWNRGADGQPTSWVINITGKKAKETTIQMRFGKENDWKSGQVYLFFTRFLPSECLKDVRRCLKKERIGPILKKLRDKEASNPSTTLSTNQALYVLCKQLKVVAFSSCEAEYAAAAYACKEIEFIRHLCSDMGFPFDGPLAFGVDNTAAIDVAYNMGVSGRTKHFDMAIHYFRDCVQLLSVVPRHVLTKFQRADIFTKALDKTTFITHRDCFLT